MRIKYILDLKKKKVKTILAESLFMLMGKYL